MDCPGEYLRRERELREVSLEDISSEIKVSVRLLKALEADDYQTLPHTAFVKGFIKAYCKYLGLDGNEALLRYELYLQEIAEFEEPAKKPKSLDVAERSYPVRKFLTLFLVAIGVIIIAGVYYFGSTPDDKPDVKVAEKPAEVVTNEKPPAAEYVKGAASKKDAEQGGTLKVAVKVPEAKPVPEKGKPRVDSPAIEPPKEIARKVGQKKTVEESATKPVESVRPFDLTSVGLGEGEHLLRANATELTWMKVTIDSNAPFEVMLQPGERTQWRGKVFFCS